MNNTIKGKGVFTQRREGISYEGGFAKSKRVVLSDSTYTCV